ncbi:MAG: putative metallopeptidase [Candidatus Aenigmatarchaeota archaeon]
MRYEIDFDTWNASKDIVSKLCFHHIDLEKVVFLRSHGSKAKRTIARIHGLPKIMQIAMNMKAFYVIEMISENFDKLENDDKTKTIIHELMHIPKGFGGGFRNHRNFVTRKNVEIAFREYMSSLQTF